MEESAKPQANKSLAGKNLITGIGLLALFSIGMVLGSAAKVCPSNNCNINSLSETASDTTTNEQEIQKSGIEYKTFSEPDIYFTFEYPSTWTYEKEGPKESYPETYYVFYTDNDKKTEAFRLNYPMFETAMDTCLKFEEVTDYKHEHIATNDPGTFVNYITCSRVADTIFESKNPLGDIFWQKGTWDGDRSLTSDINTQVRINWGVDNDALTEEISRHIAHSVKIVK